MGDPKLKIAPKRYGGESMVISMRLSREMLQEIDGAARATGRTRNEIMSMALEYALDHMEVSSGAEQGEENQQEKE